MNPADHISKYVTYSEATHSQNAVRLGISNEPSDEQLSAMKYVAEQIFDEVREYLNEPLGVSSFFRSHALNNGTPGSSKISQHMKGEAVDMIKPGRHKEIFNWIRENLEFDQLIWEYGTKDEPAWVHCSKVNYRANRKEILRAFLDSENNMRYIPFDL